MPAEPRPVRRRVLARLERRRPFPWRPLAACALAVVALAVGDRLRGPAGPHARSCASSTSSGASVDARRRRCRRRSSAPQARRARRPLARDARAASSASSSLLPSAARRAVRAWAIIARVGRRPAPTAARVLVSEFHGGMGSSSRSSSPARPRSSASGSTGRPALWLEGAPHVAEYFDRCRGFRERAVLIRGNVLLWVRGGRSPCASKAS